MDFLNTIPNNVTEKVLPPVPLAMWLKHFNNLHQLLSVNNQTITNVLEKLTKLEASVMDRNELDFVISANHKEILNTKQRNSKTKNHHTLTL